jgi:hypothetical protein
MSTPSAIPVADRPWALHIPADPAKTCTLAPLPASGAAPLPGTRRAVVVARWVDVADGQAYCWWEPADHQPEGSGSSPRSNERAFLLAARLGCVDLADRIGLHTDVLLSGLAQDGAPTDVPGPILDAARRGGLIIALPRRTPDLHLPAPIRPVTFLCDLDLLRRVLAGLRHQHGLTPRP